MGFSPLPNPWKGVPTVGPFFDNIQNALAASPEIGDSPTFNTLTLSGIGKTTLALTDTTGSTGLTIGGDTNIYRYAAGILRTDSTLWVPNIALTGTTGAITNSGPTSVTTAWIASKISTDSTWRFNVNADGKQWWGSGTSALDTNLYRSAAGVLSTDGAFAAFLSNSNQIVLGRTASGTAGPGITFGSAQDTNLYRASTGWLKTDGQFIVVGAGGIGYKYNPATGTGNAFYSSIASDSYAMFSIQYQGQMNWGLGGTNPTDTNLYRSAAAILKTDGVFQAGQDVTARVGDAAQVQIGKSGPSAQSGISFQNGEAGSNLYRAGAGQIKTDGSFYAVGNIVLFGNSSSALYGTGSAASSTARIITNVAGDALNRFQMNADGTFNWGSGASSFDTQLYRSGVGSLTLGTSSLAGRLNVVTGATSTATVATYVTTDTNPRFYISGDGSLNWGSGSGATDVSMIRSTISTTGAVGLKVGQDMQVNTLTIGSATAGIYVRNISSTATSILVGRLSTDSNDRIAVGVDGKLWWGPGNVSGDTNLYRSAAGVLKTDGALTLGSGLNLGATMTIGSLGNITLATATNYSHTLSPSDIVSSPSAISWHDIASFNRITTPLFETSVDGTTWVTGTLDNRMFNQKGNQTVQIIDGVTKIAARWTWNASGLAYSYPYWLIIAFTYNSVAPTRNILLEKSTDSGTTWTTAFTVTGNASNAQVLSCLTGIADGTNAIRLTITQTNSTPLMMSQIKLMAYRIGDQGNGPELQYPYNWSDDGTMLGINKGTSVPSYNLDVNGTGRFVNTVYANNTGTAINANGSILGSQLASTTTTAFAANVTGDSQSRFIIGADGKTSWGPGGSVGVDTNLYRNAAAQLKTDSQFYANALFVTPPGVGNSAYNSKLSADANQRLLIYADGKITWGDGTNSQDTNLYRGSAGRLVTDYVFNAISGVRAEGMSSSTSIAFAADVSADTVDRFQIDASGKHQWGSGSVAQDTNLYREAASVLTTDSQFHVNNASGVKFSDGTTQTTSATTPSGTMSPYAGFTAPSGWSLADGGTMSRTAYSALMSAITVTRSGSTTSASPTVTGLSSTDYLAVGCPVEGTGIPANTTILSVDSATQVTLSANATATGTPSLTFFPYGNGDGSTTFNKPDTRGRMLGGVGIKSAGGHADMWGLGSNDGSALGSRRMKHSHGVGTLAFTGTAGTTGTEGAHTHGPGTFSISGGSHGHGITDNGHTHSAGPAGWGNGFVVYGNTSNGGTDPAGGSGTRWGIGNTTTVVSSTTGISINSNTHSHPSTEWSGATGAGTAHSHSFTPAGTLSGSVGTTSSAPTESAAYLVVNYIIKL